jgi:hypothetical protein
MITAITPAKIGRVMKKREKRMGISSVEGRAGPRETRNTSRSPAEAGVQLGERH